MKPDLDSPPPPSASAVTEDTGPPSGRMARRGAITKLAVTAATGALFWRYLTPEVRRAAPTLRVAASDVPRDGALVFAAERVAIIDRGGARYALSLRCTHLGCTAAVDADAIRCHCHGSVFDLTGAVVRGPAESALRALPMSVVGDDLEVTL